MKFSSFPIKSLAFLFLTAATLSWSCSKSSSNNTNGTYTISGNASGANESPAVTTNATGALTGTFDPNTNTLQYTITWANLTDSAIAAHFHGPAGIGANANVEIPIVLNTRNPSGTASGTVVMSASQVTDLLGGNLYWNVHSKTHPGGEIRGQVVATR
jgi:hypothetical protein